MTQSFKLKPFKITEHQRQIEIVSWLRANGFLVFCLDVMTALSKMPTQAARMAFIKHYKAMGYTKGQPDLVAIKKDGTLPPIFFEVKTDEGRLSPEQKEIAAELSSDENVLYAVIRHWTELAKYISGLYHPLPVATDEEIKEMIATNKEVKSLFDLTEE